MRILFFLMVITSIYLLLLTSNDSNSKQHTKSVSKRFKFVPNLHVRNALFSGLTLVTVGGVKGLFMSTIILGVLYLAVPKLQERELNNAKRISAMELASVTEQLAMCLSVGMTTQQSLRFVSNSKQSDSTKALARSMLAMELGQALPNSLEMLIAKDSSWQPVLDILIQGHNSGGQLIASLDALLLQLRDEAQSEKTRKIRGVAVRCVLPLGLCFLPAFIVLTIVPLVATFISQLAW